MTESDNKTGIGSFQSFLNKESNKLAPKWLQSSLLPVVDAQGCSLHRATAGFTTVTFLTSSVSANSDVSSSHSKYRKMRANRGNLRLFIGFFINLFIHSRDKHFPRAYCVSGTVLAPRARQWTTEFLSSRSSRSTRGTDKGQAAKQAGYVTQRRQVQ